MQAVPTNATFLLCVNCAIGVSFATAFISCRRHVNSRLPVWCAAGFLSASFTALVEVVAPLGLPSALISFISYAMLITALTCIVSGLVDHLCQEKLFIPIFLRSFYVVALIWHPAVLLHANRDSLLHSFGYQVPFGIICTTGGIICWQHRQSTWNRVVSLILAATAVQFMAKSALAYFISTGKSVDTYAYSTYASVSQAAGAVLSIGLGIALLAMILFEALTRHLQASQHDFLSGILNRYGFLQWLADNRDLTEKNSYYLAVCDLDRFKDINDTFGHSAGDEVIRRTALFLKDACNHGVVARFGGEEFVMLYQAGSERSAWAEADRIRNGLCSTNLKIGTAEAQVTISIGLTQWRHMERLDDVVCRADSALYRAKGAGRNRVELS